MEKNIATVSSIQQQTQSIEQLLTRLKTASNLSEKLRIIGEVPDVVEFLKGHSAFSKILSSLKPDREYLMKAVLAIGQGPFVFRDIEKTDHAHGLINAMLTIFQEMETFYDELGGIIGYHLTILRLIIEKNQGQSPLSHQVHYHMPVGWDLSKKSQEVQAAIRDGIASLKWMAEIYPIGGAGDRLHFHDPATGEALPVAALPFAGKTLLEGLVEDLQAKEYLHYKLFGEQLTTPIAMMTSKEKNNHEHIVALCEKHKWFHRDPNSFRLFTQPLVPVVTIEGNWVTEKPLQLLLKPGGHGVIWKQALDNGIFDWLIEQKRQWALIRQINNPAAGIDYGILAFTGFGTLNNKVFGFASCQRLLNAAEGMDILIEKELDSTHEYAISNVEYTEFEKHGIHDIPATEGSEYSKFPANTNILFADLNAIQPFVRKCPAPGMLINMKNTVNFVDLEGKERAVAAGRLESTMQNISDCIVDRFPEHLENVSPSDFSTYITFNDRRRTLSVTKKAYAEGSSFLETPEGCFYELQQNYYDLLTRYCHFTMPPLDNVRNYIENGSGCIVKIHPAAGPLYQIIAQKLQKGSLSFGSELQLEIAEFDIKDLHVDGSLLIAADAVAGHLNSNGRTVYGENSGKCTLHSVKVKNKGVDRSSKNPFIAAQIHRKEALRITLHGNAEFFAENCIFNGDKEFEVRDGYRMIAYMNGEEVRTKEEKIDAPTWYWRYTFDDNNDVAIHKAE